MQCVPNSHVTVAAIKRAKRLRYGVDSNHVCEAGVCEYWQSPVCRRTFVCKFALHIHVCSDECTLAECTRSGYFVCPISGIELSHKPFVHSEVSKVTGKGGERWVQTYTYSKRDTHKVRKKAPRQLCSGVSTRATVLRACTAHIPTPRIVAKLAKLITHRNNFVCVLNAACSAMSVHKPTSECPAWLIKQITAYCNTIGPVLDPPSGQSVLVCTVLSLLAVGFEARGVVIFPRLEWVRSNSPPLTMYAHVDNVHCRGMSTCTRAVKRVVLADTGIAALYVFPSPPAAS